MIHKRYHISYLVFLSVLVLFLLSCKGNKELPEPEEPENKYTVIAERGYTLYSDFGAKGDGKTDDIDAIATTHTYANQHGLPVKADQGATYYISGKNRTADIRTDTDFGTASFLIDDTNIQNRNTHIFTVSSGLEIHQTMPELPH